jgi:hypothetical protein
VDDILYRVMALAQNVSFPPGCLVCFNSRNIYFTEGIRKSSPIVGEKEMWYQGLSITSADLTIRDMWC